MPKIPKITAEIRQWRFNGQHRLEGHIYNDTRDIGYLDGDYAGVILINSISEFQEFFLVKTAAQTCYILYKEHESYHSKDQNLLSLHHYKGRGANDN